MENNSLNDLLPKSSTKREGNNNQKIPKTLYSDETCTVEPQLSVQGWHLAVDSIHPWCEVIGMVIYLYVSFQKTHKPCLIMRKKIDPLSEEDATENQFSSSCCVNPGLKLMNFIAERKWNNT